MKLPGKQQYDASSEMKELSTTLQRLLDINHLNVNKLSKNTGITTTVIYKMLDAKVASNPTVQTLLAIAKFFGITLDQLFGREFIPDTERIGARGYIENPSLWPSIPFISWEDIKTYLSLPITERKEKYGNNTFKTDAELSEEAFALKIEEIAEWSSFPVGSILVVDPLARPQSRDYVLVCKRNNEKPTLRQIIIDGDEHYLRSLMFAVENKIIPVSNEWEILATVKEITYKKN